MSVFTDKSIRHKLKIILIVTTSLALGLAGVAMVAFDIQNQASTVEKNLVMQADIIALTSGSALAFDDYKAAFENLSVLRANTSVASATLFDEKGARFAIYSSVDPGANALTNDVPPTAPPIGETLDLKWVTVSRPVVLNGEYLGTVHLRAQHYLANRTLEYLSALLVILSSSLAAALMLSDRLLRRVTAPILAVSATATSVMTKGDFNLRAQKSTNDEAGALVDAFNAMLDELGRRANTLEQANLALRLSEERYQLAVRGSSAGLWDWDMLARTTYYSPRFKALLGYSSDEFPDLPGSMRRVVHMDDWPLLKAALQEHFEGDQPFQVECRMRLSNGQWAWCFIAGIAQKDADGVPYRMAGSIIDITERKNAERSLKEADRAKDQFIATLAHELRNPLAPIRTGLDILCRDNLNGPVSERTRAIMDRQLMHMVRLIDDLLDISRIASGKIWLQKSPTKLATIIERSVELSAPAITALGHELIVDVHDLETELDADLTRLAQAVANLLNNAAKYTPRGGAILLKAWRDAKEAVVAVQDNGVGIAPEMLGLVFSLFAQVDRSMDRSQNGLGIGLSLVKSFVELHGGRVIAASPGLNLGSTFTVRIPCRDHPCDPRSIDQKADFDDKALRCYKVLVVDDNADAADTLVYALKLMGHEALALNSSINVQATALDFKPDVILLDVGLPGMSGHEVAKLLRADSRLKDIVLVALTGWGSDADRHAARAAGFHHHLTKPVKIDALSALLSSALHDQRDEKVVVA